MRKWWNRGCGSSGLRSEKLAGEFSRQAGNRFSAEGLRRRRLGRLWEKAERGIAARHHVTRVARRGQRVVETTEISGAIHTEDFTASGDIAHVIVRREVPDRAGGPCRLADVPVVENELISPRNRVVEIVFPASTDNRPAVGAYRRKAS